MMESDEQTTNHLTAAALVAPLWDKSVRCMNITLEGNAHIAWMSLDRSEDYKEFNIESYNYTDHRGRKKNVATEQKISDLVVENLFPQNQINVCMAYHPLHALDSKKGEKSHLAYLLIVTDSPTTRTIRVQLNGVPRGLGSNKCGGAAAIDPIEYHAKAGKIDLYVCDTVVAEQDLVTDAERPNTNFTKVPVEGTFNFYQVDDQTLCLIGRELGAPPSIPDFMLPVPPVDGVPEKILEEGLEVRVEGLHEGTIGADGELLWTTVTLNVGDIVPVSPLKVSNGTLIPSAPDCPTFATPPKGTGTIDTNELILVVSGEVFSTNTTVNGFGIDGALIFAVLHLEKI